MVIYLDVLLFENFIVNLFLLHVTFQSLRVKVKNRLMILSALSGTLYVLTMLFDKLSFFTKLPFTLLTAFLMLYIVQHGNKLLFIIKSTGLFILYSMLLSGFCVFIEYEQQISSLQDVLLPGYSTDFSYKGLLVSIMILYMVIFRFIVFLQDRRAMAAYTYTVEIVTREFTKTVKAFLDTGNELREPVTNLPVMVVERNILQELNIKDGEKLFIPYKVINGSGGRLEGFKPQFIKIYYGDNKFELRDVIIGFCENKLSEMDDYEALLSRGII